MSAQKAKPPEGRPGEPIQEGAEQKQPEKEETAVRERGRTSRERMTELQTKLYQTALKV